MLFRNKTFAALAASLAASNDAACLFPYMRAVRFFADYLNGDTYYKIKYPEHNLVRTRNQIALFKSAMEKVPEMKAFIAGTGK